VAARDERDGMHASMRWFTKGRGEKVFSTVVIGGLTRLTESGLSIVEWRPVSGAIPPLSHEDWEKEFDKYKESPEYKLYVKETKQ